MERGQDQSEGGEQYKRDSYKDDFVVSSFGNGVNGLGDIRDSKEIITRDKKGYKRVDNGKGDDSYVDGSANVAASDGVD